MTNTDPSLLLVLPLGVYREGQQAFIDAQAANGLRLWLQHFSRVTLCAKAMQGPPPGDHIHLDLKTFRDRLVLELLPCGWGLAAQLAAYLPVRKRLQDLVDRHDYLHFALMGGLGDWSALGIRIASAKGRKASVWTDRVESKVISIEASRRRGLSRISRLINARIARGNEAKAISTATIGLFHGRDTYDHFGARSRQPFLVHDIHLKRADRIGDEELRCKTVEARSGPLKIVYAGRVHPDKGVHDWIEALRISAARGVRFQATWYGEGVDLKEARHIVELAGLADQVRFPGAIWDRQQLLAELRGAHVMLFCHLTPESPRCLIEALVCGTPLVGFASPYSQDLVARHGGGMLTGLEPSALAECLQQLDHNRDVLVNLIRNAALDGEGMTDETVFAHRAELIKAYT